MTIVIGNQVVRFVMPPSITVCMCKCLQQVYFYSLLQYGNDDADDDDVFVYFYFADFDGWKCAYIEQQHFTVQRLQK